MFNKKSRFKNNYQLDGSLRRQGYDWWWHSFTAINKKTGEERPFFLEFFICNPSLAKDEPVLGQSEYNKEHHIKPSYLMIKAGAWGKNPVQLHRFFSIKDIKIKKFNSFSIEAADCFLSDYMSKGSVKVTSDDASKKEYMSDEGEISWDLTIDKKIAFNVGYGTSRPLRRVKAFEMYWHAEGMKTLYSGIIKLNGEEYIVKKETSYGYADKNWGRNFTSPWVWLASSNLYSVTQNKKLENSCFDIGGGKPKIYHISLQNILLGCLYLEGKEYEFNFSKVWTHAKTKMDCYYDNEKCYWNIVMTNRDYILEINCTSNLSEMLNINYESPDGEKRYSNLKNGGAGIGTLKLYDKNHNLVEEILAKNIGCEYGVYDE